MPCYFVSNGVEMSMINETFHFIWNGFGNKEFIDNETFHLKRTTKQTHPLTRTPMLNGENKMTDITTRKPNDETYFQKYCQERTKQPCVCDICGSDLSCKSNLAKHKKTKKCQRFLV